MTTSYITASDVPMVLANTKGGFFSVEYIARTTGERKTMNATLHYKGATVGGSSSYNATEKRLTIVRDLNATRRGERPIRSLAWEGVRRITFNKMVYIVVDDDTMAELDEQANLYRDAIALGEL